MSLRKFPCNACGLVFENSQTQRVHMREAWHIYNLKRRMADLPPISAATYIDKVATKLVSSKQERLEDRSPPTTARSLQDDQEPAGESDQFDASQNGQARTNCCLFCTQYSDNLETNIKHMSSEHGLYIPDIDFLTSLETFVEYLRTVITEYNECLFCGATKQSVDGVRRHMLDRGHCMVNLEREPELLEFWDFSGSDGHDSDNEYVPTPHARKVEAFVPKDPSQDEHILPSGKIIGSKSKAREARLLTRRAALAAKNASGQSTIEGSADSTDLTSSAPAVSDIIESQKKPQGQAVSVRDAAGLVGISDQQIRSLTTMRRVTQRQQAVVRASASWADELGGTHQKHYKQKMNLRDG